MFNVFKKKCPVCKMELTDDYIERFGKKFCSENCQEVYRKKLVEGKSKSGGGCCH